MGEEGSNENRLFFPWRGGAVTKIGHFNAFNTPFRGRTPRSSKKIEKFHGRVGVLTIIGHFFMLLNRRSEVDPPSPGHQFFWSKSLSEHRFKAHFPSKNHKNFRKPRENTPLQPREKNLGDDT